MSACEWCPFMACARCEWQGWDTSARQGEIPGLTCDNRTVLADKRTAPGGALTPLVRGPRRWIRSD